MEAKESSNWPEISTQLDIGCGDLKRGSLGIDISKSSRADIRASAEYLPFKQGTLFKSTFASHVIEHVPDPIKFLADMKRLSTGSVILEFPKPEYGNALKLTVREFLLAFPISLLHPRLAYYFLRKFFLLQRRDPRVYHRWLIQPEVLGIAVEEDEKQFLCFMKPLTYGRKGRFFKHLRQGGIIVGLKSRPLTY